MFVGTLFTLFVVPSLYVLIAKDHSKERLPGRDEAERPAGAAPAPA
jgi:multidrug efflux pump